MRFLQYELKCITIPAFEQNIFTVPQVANAILDTWAYMHVFLYCNDVMFAVPVGPTFKSSCR